MEDPTNVAEIPLEMSRSFTVRAGNFEGPLELLLSLIESRKLFINEVSLGSVTNEYLEHVRGLPAMSMSEVTSFLIVAATLVLIKSRSLLPNLELTTDEQDKIVDLELRLKLYQIIREAGQGIATIFNTRVLRLSPPKMRSEPIFTPDAHVTISELHSALASLIDRMPKETEKAPVVTVSRIMSIDEMIQDLTSRIEQSFQTSFTELTKRYSNQTREDRVHTIVSFLAVLELVRNGILDVIQEVTFDTITIQKL